MNEPGRSPADKPVAEMTRAEVKSELQWRVKAQGEMVGTLYPVINGNRIAELRTRERELDHPPCLRCEKPVHLAGAERCNNCWEVESRLGDYLRSADGRKYVMDQFRTYHGGSLDPIAEYFKDYRRYHAKGA